MKVIWASILFAFALVATVQAQLQIAGLPHCALTCLLAGISNSTCPLSNSTCLCSDTALMNRVGACTLANCTVKESLTAQNVTQAACGFPPRNEQTTILSLSSVFMGLALMAVGLKVATHFSTMSQRSFRSADWFIISATICSIASTVMVYLMVKEGFGRDIWTVPFDSITLSLKWLCIAELFYIITQTLARMSFLFFYLSIFPTRGFRMCVYIVMAYSIAHWIAFFPVALFQCTPVPYAWTRWDGEHVGTCVNINVVGWVNAASNMLLDALTVILPMVPLSKLELTRKKKFSLMGILGLGFFITIVSILRLQTLIQFGNTQNPTWDYVTTAYWSLIEIDVTIFCACLPAIYGLFNRSRISKSDISRPTLDKPSKPNQLQSYKYDSGIHVADIGGITKTIEQSVTVVSSGDSHSYRSDNFELMAVDSKASRHTSFQFD